MPFQNGNKMSNNKAISQILSLDPVRTSLASEDPEVNAWNADVLDQVVQRAIRTFPKTPSKLDLQEYRSLSERANLLSKHFEERSPEYTRLAEHIAELRELIGPFEIERAEAAEDLFNHPLSQFILEFDGSFDETMAPRLRLQLIQYMRKCLIPVILESDSKSDRKKLHALLMQLTYIGKAFDHFDLDGSFEDAFRDGLKQFLFKGVTSHHIYQNLLRFPKGFSEIGSKKEKEVVAKGIAAFVQYKLAPFLRDLDVQPSYEEIETIAKNLRLFNHDLLKSSIQILESFL